MTTKRALLVSPDSQIREGFSALLARRERPVEVEGTALMVDALKRLATEPFDCVVTTADCEADLAALVRLKKARPDLPAAVLIQPDASKLRFLAEYMGANAVVEWHPDVERTAELLNRAIQTWALARQNNAYVRQARHLVQEVRALTRANCELIGTAIGLAAREDRRDFSMLLVEDDPNAMLVLVRSLARAGLPPFVHGAGTVDEALEYLEGRGRFADRARYPMPTLIISDLNLPGSNGFDLLRRVRSTPATSHVGFILFTSSQKSEDMDRAFALGANFYVDKGGGTDALIDVVKIIYARTKPADSPSC